MHNDDTVKRRFEEVQRVVLTNLQEWRKKLMDLGFEHF